MKCEVCTDRQCRDGKDCFDGAASRVEAEHYFKIPRLQELVEFSKLMRYKKLGLPKIHGDGFEATCNPVGQALLLEEEGTDLNVILGLCLGHDVLFTKHSKAPVTTLAVKDRVLAHNPLGVIYSGYYRRAWERQSGSR